MKQKLKRVARILKFAWGKEIKFPVTPMKQVEAKGLVWDRKQPVIRTEARRMTLALWGEESGLIA